MLEPVCSCWRERDEVGPVWSLRERDAVGLVEFWPDRLWITVNRIQTVKYLTDAR